MNKKITAKEGFVMKGVSCVLLEYGKYSAVISPEYGSSVWRMRDEEAGIEVFRYSDKCSAAQIDKAREIWGLPTLYLPNRFDGGLLKTSDGDYHLPVNEEAFTHRNGRTARWDATGTSYLILHAEEKLPEYIPEDVETMELPENPSRPPKSVWTTIYIGKGKKEKLSRMDIAGFLYKKGNLTREDVGAIDVKEHYAFVAVRRAKVKQLLNLIQGEKIKGMKTIIEEAK